MPLHHCTSVSPRFKGLTLSSRVLINVYCNGCGFFAYNWKLSAPQRCNAERSDAQRKFFTTLPIPLFFTASSLWCPSLFFSIARSNFLHRTHRPSAFASIFPFATMVYCTKQQEICQESQRSDVATGNARWPSQTQTQTQRCGALRLEASCLLGHIFWGGMRVKEVPRPPMFCFQNMSQKWIPHGSSECLYKWMSRSKAPFFFSFFAYSWKLAAYSGAFRLQLTVLAFLLTVGALLLTALAFLLTVGAYLLTVGKCV